MMKATPEMHLTHPYWLIYFAVDDCDKIVAKAQQLGGKTMLPPTDIPNIGRFSVLTDPQGAYFAIIAMAKQA
jgi:predicted enzyme related to lactoylglutathione lyase